MAALLIACTLADIARAQIPSKTPAGEMVLFKSSAASRVVEKVRSEAQGVVVEVSVSVE